MITPPDSESIPKISLIKSFRILLSKCEKYSIDRLTWTRRIHSLCRGVFGSEAVAEAFLYLCSRGAVTAWLLQVQLGLSEASAYRVLKHLRSLQLVEPVLKLPRKKLKRSGPIPKIWGLVGSYTGEDVAFCIILHYRSLHIRPSRHTEVSYREILLHIKEMRFPFSTLDVVGLAA